MGYGPAGWLIVVLGGAAALAAWQLVHFAAVVAWGEVQTAGERYYTLPPEARRRYKRLLRLHAALLWPLLAVLPRWAPFRFERGSFHADGLAFPRGTCSAESVARAKAWRPDGNDVFVVTPMKCGTTWMQHLVVQVLHRGGRNLAAEGQSLHALSAWLEGTKTVLPEAAPRLGIPPRRVLKTHLPADACPWSAEAKYIYVTRHPVSCFASCRDFLRTNLGQFAPDLQAMCDWFCGPGMWWGRWTAHLAGWQRRADCSPNVLLVRFEDMKRDLATVARRVAAHLEAPPLTDEELAAVVGRCSFQAMQRDHEAFEMNPPHLLQTAGQFFMRGTADRHRDVPPDVRRRIETVCRDEARQLGLSLAAFYPELADGQDVPLGQPAAVSV